MSCFVIILCRFVECCECGKWLVHFGRDEDQAIVVQQTQAHKVGPSVNCTTLPGIAKQDTAEDQAEGQSG